MAYTKQTWNNDDEATPISAERLTHIEDGIEAAATAADDVPTAAEVGAVPTSRTVAGKPLSANVTIATADVTGLVAALADKQDSGSYATTSALTSGLAGKAATSHTHTIANVTDLQAALDAKGTSNLAIGTTASTAAAGTRGLSGTAAAQADSVATDVAGLVTDFNALLAKLRTRGVLA